MDINHHSEDSLIRTGMNETDELDISAMLIKNTIKKEVLMARQPIFNNKLETVAYELLYRGDHSDNQAVFDFSGSLATINVLLNSYTSVYQNNQLKRMPAFLNLTYDLIVNDTLPNLPTNQIVLEILEDIEVDARLIKSVKSLCNKGYKIALDDFVYDDKYIPLLQLAQIIKVDVLGMTPEQVIAQVEKLKPYKVTLLAEKIETHAMYQHCKDLGFKLFQGYFLSTPEMVQGSKVKPTQAKLLSILQALQDPNVTSTKLEKLIIQDPVFTFKLLRIVNSSANKLVREIESVSEAINILGIADMKKWALIIAMLSNQGKPEELTRQLLIRGHMCEKVACASGVKDISGYMIAGMMSGVNALLDIEQKELLEQIPLTQEIKAAIIKGTGVMGNILRNTIHFGEGNWQQMSADFDTDIYAKAYLESLDWACNSMHCIDN
ncbi:MAG: HDOD domain-containing protein [Pseudomonadales bacterium]|nr:HDOD domain-containing protein [Pseudomonadales bacterium]NRA17768.1 HDOD domain-containing protein [Oceanospirillaceae bacterium]